MDRNKEYKKKAELLAKRHGFDSVSYYGEWGVFSAYTASKEVDEDCCIGYPQFILIKDGIASLASYTQSPDIMGISSMPKGYAEVLP